MNKKILRIAFIIIGLTGCENKLVMPSSSEYSSTYFTDSILSSESIISSIEESSSIEIKTITTAKMESKTFYYDGYTHSLKVTGAPSNANITYTNNGKIDIGEYSVIASIIAEGYEPLELTSTLKIIGKFSNITFENQTFEQDGEYHSIYVDNVPEFATVTYSNNNKKAIGEYTVTATIKANNYETFTIKAKMTIIEPLLKFENVSYTNKTFLYSGYPYENVIEYSSLPYKTDVSYECINNKNIVNKATDVGIYNMKATISRSGYQTLELYSTLTILDMNDYITSNNDNQFTFDENLKYQKLLEELSKGNYTCRVSFDMEWYERGTRDAYDYKYYSDLYYAIADNKFFKCYLDYKYNETSKYTDYMLVDFGRIYDEYVLYNDCEYLFDTVPFEEAYKYRLTLTEFAKKFSNDTTFTKYLTEDEITGGFVDTYNSGVYGHLVSLDNNSFTFEYRIHYYHPEFDDDEIVTFTYYNIGNTVVNIPSTFDINESNMEDYKSK